MTFGALVLILDLQNLPYWFDSLVYVNIKCTGLKTFEGQLSFL